MNLESLPTTQLSYWVEWVKWSELLIWKFWQQLTCSPRHTLTNSQIRILNVHTFLESSYCFVKSNKKWTNKTYFEWLITNSWKFKIGNSCMFQLDTRIFTIFFTKLSTNKIKFVGLFVAFIHPNLKVPKIWINLKFGLGNS